MKEKLRVNPSKVSISFFGQRNGTTGSPRYVVGDYLGQSITRHYQHPSRKSIISPTTVKTLLDLVYEPVIIGAFIIAICIVGSVYALSQWYYADFDPEPIPTENPVSKLADSPALLVSMDLSKLSSWDTESDWEATAAAEPTQAESEVGSYKLTPEDEALLLEHFAETLPLPPRESPFGLGPYPKLPPDWPRQNIWDVLERDYKDGYAAIEHELIQRVLVKLWKQGKQTDSAIVEDGKVYPLYTDTIYIRWAESEDEDGTPYRYVSEVLCHQSLAHYDEDIDRGIMPSGIKVIEQDGAGIDPYSFLDLP